MLAPGEYVLKPQHEKPTSAPNVGQPGDSPKPPAPAAEAEETESRSFLLILLRALGAIHT